MSLTDVVTKLSAKATSAIEERCDTHSLLADWAKVASGSLESSRTEAASKRIIRDAVKMAREVVRLRQIVLDLVEAIGAEEAERVLAPHGHSRADPLDSLRVMCLEWNLKHPRGTWVRYKGRKTQTRGQAIVLFGGAMLVHISGEKDQVRVSELEILQSDDEPSESI